MTNLDATADVTLPRLTLTDVVRGWAASVALGVVVLASLASAMTAGGTLVADDAGATPKVYHVLVTLAGAVVAFRGRFVVPRREVLVYFAVTITASLLAYLAFEPRVAVIKLAIALYVAAVATAIGRATSRRTVLRACRIASAAFLAIVTMKNVLHASAFVVYLANPFGHPDIPSFAGGGLNLEATWLALSAVFFIGTAWFVPFALAAATTSALYASRAGLVLVGLAAIAAVPRGWLAGQGTGAEVGTSRRRGHAVIGALFALVAASGFGYAYRVAGTYGDTGYVAERFATIGEEPGSLGRVTLWRGGLQVFAEHPLGVGVGNAVPALRRTLGVDVPEDNLHNIYLQHAVETGLPGLAVLVVLAVSTARRALRGRLRDHLLLFVGGYLVAGAIQFTGVDATLWLVYGLQAGSTGSSDA